MFFLYYIYIPVIYYFGCVAVPSTMSDRPTATLRSAAVLVQDVAPRAARLDNSILVICDSLFANFAFPSSIDVVPLRGGHFRDALRTLGQCFLAGKAYETIVLAIGTNDVSDVVLSRHPVAPDHPRARFTPASPVITADILMDLCRLLSRARTMFPTATLIVFDILPRRCDEPSSRHVRARIQSFLLGWARHNTAAGFDSHFRALAPLCYKPDGALKADFYKGDGLHLAEKGLQHLGANLLRRIPGARNRAAVPRRHVQQGNLHVFSAW